MASHIHYHYYEPGNRKDWQQLRSWFQGVGNDDTFRVGGSDIGVILGCDKYKASGLLFHEMVGTRPIERRVNPEMLRGTILESVIYKEWYRYYDPANPTDEQWIANREEGRIVRTARKVNAIVTNEKYPHAFANVDYLINKREYPFGYGDNEFPYYKYSNQVGLLELKSLTKYSMDQWEGQLAPNYVYQPQYYMMIFELNWCEDFVLRDATYPILFPFERNETLIGQIQTSLDDFARRVMTVKGLRKSGAPKEEIEAAAAELEPPVGSSEGWKAFLQAQHNPDNWVKVDGKQEELDLVIRYLENNQDMDPYKERKDLYENQIRDLFIKRNAKEIDFGEIGKISWVSRFNVPKSILTKWKQIA